MTDAASSSPVTVLVVDDHADVRFLVRTILRDAGQPLEVAGEAAGGREAVEAADRLDPTVVVLDARMPVIDGFETAALILERRPGQPILLCSAIVDEEIRARAERTGIAACVSKDDFEAIPELVLELARGQTP
jgi:CheY-like chemotaxis protein